MSPVPQSSLETVAPKYTNISTSSISRKFTSTISLFREFIRSSLHLSTLSFSPTLPSSWASLSVLVWMCCCLVDDERAISSAKSKSSSFVLNFRLIPVFPSCHVFHIAKSTTSRNSKADMLQPCFTPVLILNHSVVYTLAIHYCACKVIVERFHHADYLGWYAVASHNQP